MCGIILTVKRLLALTIPILLCVGASGRLAAYAETETLYPDDSDFITTLTFTSLTDFAVGDGGYAFAEGDTVYIYKDGELASYNHGAYITNVDYDGGFIFADADGCYTLGSNYESADKLEETHEFSVYTTYVNPADESVYKVNGGYLQYCANEENTFTNVEGLGEVVSFKLYGSAIYTVSNNRLYRVSGPTSQEIVPEYSDYSVTTGISTGNAAEALLDYSLTFVTIDNGAYITAVDLSELSDSFNPDGSSPTLKTNETVTALLLCYTGNAAIVAIGYDAYITLKSHTHEVPFSYDDDKDYETATVVGDRIYASPFVASATVVLDAAGTTVEVINKLSSDVLGCVFYEVRYGENVGYVAEGFLTAYIFEDNREPTEVPDKNYSEEDNVRTVLLIFAVVVLVMVAVGYVVFVITSDRRRNKNIPPIEDGKE